MPASVKLDTTSELMVLSSYANTKNIILMGAEAKGPFDEEAFRSAVKRVCAIFPTLTSTLREMRQGGRYFLFREFHPEEELPVTVSEVKTPSRSRTSFDTLVRHFTPRLDRNWDLMHERPVEIHVLRLEPQHVIMAFIFHHVSGDAAMALKVVSETLGQYDAIVTGKESDWAAMPYVFSHPRKKPQSPAKPV